MFGLCFVWICQFDIIQIRMENSELEYNENLPPAHELKYPSYHADWNILRKW